MPKQAEVTNLPEGWEIKRLEEIAEKIVGGGTPKTEVQEYWNGSIEWLTPSEATKLKTFYVFSTKRKISELGLNSSNLTLLPKNSILMTSRASIGDIVINSKPMATNQGFISMIPSKEVHTLFLAYSLSAKKQLFLALSSGSTFLELSKSAYRKFQILLPPLLEQQRISRVLQSVDVTLEAARETQAQAQRLRDTVMQNLLTQGKKIRLKEIVRGFFGGVSVIGLSREKQGIEKGVLKISAVSKGQFHPNQNKAITNTKELNKAKLTVKKGMVLFSRSNTSELVGETCYVSEDYPDLFLPDKLWSVEVSEPKKTCLKWLAYALLVAKTNKVFFRLATGSSGSMKNISKAKQIGRAHV